MMFEGGGHWSEKRGKGWSLIFPKKRLGNAFVDFDVFNEVYDAIHR